MAVGLPPSALPYYAATVFVYCFLTMICSYLQKIKNFYCRLSTSRPIYITEDKRNEDDSDSFSSSSTICVDSVDETVDNTPLQFADIYSIQISVETIKSWLIAYDFPNLSSISNSEINYQNDHKLSKSVIFELFSTEYFDYLNPLIDYVYNNKNEEGASMLRHSLATLILTSFCISHENLLHHQNSVSLLSDALGASRNRYVYDFVLLTLAEEDSTRNRISSFKTSNNDSKDQANSIVNINDSLLINPHHTESDKQNSLFSNEPASFDHPITGDYQRFFQTFMTKKISAAPVLGSINQLKSELWVATSSFAQQNHTSSCSPLSDARPRNEENSSTPLAASFNGLTNFRFKYTNVKTKIDHLLSTNFVDRKIVFNYSYLEQVLSAFKLLISDYEQAENLLYQYECGYVFSQLCEISCRSVEETNAMFRDMAERQSTNVNVIPQKFEVDKIEKYIYNNINMVTALTRSFKKSHIFTSGKYANIFKDQLNKLNDNCFELERHYKTINYVWIRIYDIHILVQKGISKLISMDLSDNNLAKKYSEAFEEVRSVHDKYFLVARNDTQTLIDVDLPAYVNGLKITKANSFATESDDHPSKLIVNQMINSVLQELKTLKDNCMDSSLILQKFGDKQQLKLDIERGDNWLQNFKADVLTTAIIDCLWSPDYLSTTIGQENDGNCYDCLSRHRNEFNTFTAISYEPILAYFRRYSGDIMAQCYTRKNMTIHQQQQEYEQLQQQKICRTNDLKATAIKDNHLLDEYAWLCNFDTVYNEANSILIFAGKIQQQKIDILNFINHIKQHKLKITRFQEKHLLRSSNISEKEIMAQTIAFYQSATLIFVNEFDSIEWPPLIYEDYVKSNFNNYSKSLHSELNGIRKEFMQFCFQFVRSMKA